jgi:hypothetical protein
MNKINETGSYRGKDGAIKSFTFSFEEFASVDEAIATLGEAGTLAKINRMHKLDASNPAREAAKVATGDSTRRVLTAAEKAEAKQARQLDRALLDKIKALSAEDRALLGL